LHHPEVAVLEMATHGTEGVQYGDAPDVTGRFEHMEEQQEKHERSEDGQ
jgi:hypothetical protein